MGKENLFFTYKRKRYQLTTNAIYKFLYTGEQGIKYGVLSSVDKEYANFRVDDYTMSLSLSSIAHYLDNELIEIVYHVDENHAIVSGKDKILLEVNDRKFYFQRRDSKKTVYCVKALCDRVHGLIHCKTHGFEKLTYNFSLVCNDGMVVLFKSYNFLI